MARPHRRRQVDNGVEQNVCCYCLGDGAEETALLGLRFPEDESGDCHGAEDLGAEGVEDYDHGGPGVADGF